MCAVVAPFDELELVCGLRAFNVVHGDVEAGLVAERQEARTGRGERHGVADDDVVLPVAELVGAPGNRHHAAPCR